MVSANPHSLPKNARRVQCGAQSGRSFCVVQRSLVHASPRSCRLWPLFALVLSEHAAHAGVVVHINKFSQRMTVSVDGRSPMCGRSRPGAAASARRPGGSGRNGSRAAGSRPDITARRCRIRSSSTRATRSTARTTSRASAGPPRMAACGCIRPCGDAVRAGAARRPVEYRDPDRRRQSGRARRSAVQGPRRPRIDTASLRGAGCGWLAPALLGCAARTRPTARLTPHHRLGARRRAVPGGQDLRRRGGGRRPR